MLFIKAPLSSYTHNIQTMVWSVPSATFKTRLAHNAKENVPAETSKAENEQRNKLNRFIWNRICRSTRYKTTQQQQRYTDDEKEIVVVHLKTTNEARMI